MATTPISRAEFDKERNKEIHVSSVELFHTIEYGYYQGLYADKINITGCNLYCKSCITPQYCYENKHDIVKPVKSLFHTLARKPGKGHPIYVVISGGEPTVIGQTALIALCDSMMQYKKVIVQTNGTNPFDKSLCRQPETVFVSVTIREATGYEINSGIPHIDELNLLVTDIIPSNLIHSLTNKYRGIPKYLIPDINNPIETTNISIIGKNMSRVPPSKDTEWCLRPMLIVKGRSIEKRIY